MLTTIKLLPRAYGPFRILLVTEHTLKLYRNGIASITSIVRDNPVMGTVEYLGRFIAAKISSKGGLSLSETDVYKVMKATFLGHEVCYTETCLTIKTHIKTKTSNEGKPDSKKDTVRQSTNLIGRPLRLIK